MSDRSMSGGGLVRSSFVRTLQLIVARPAVLLILYWNVFLVAGCAIAGALTLAFVSLFFGQGRGSVLGVYGAAVAFSAWYLSAQAVGTIVLVGIQHWRGCKVRVADARRMVMPRLRAAMFANLSQAGILLAWALFVLGAPSVAHLLVCDALWERVVFSLLSSGCVAVLSAYTALTLRFVVLGEGSARNALASAHVEVLRNGRIYRVAMLAVAALSCVVTAGIDALSTKVGGLTWSESLVVLLASSMVGIGCIAMQTLPYVYVAESLGSRGADILDPATASMAAALPIGKMRTSFFANRWMSVSAMTGLLILIVGMGAFVFFWRPVVHTRKIERVQSEMGLTNLPSRYRSIMALVPKIAGYRELVLGIATADGATVNVNENIYTARSLPRYRMNLGDEMPLSCVRDTPVKMRVEGRNVLISQSHCPEIAGSETQAYTQFFVGRFKEYEISAYGGLKVDALRAVEEIAREILLPERDL